jgi:hypothetical protein
VYALAAVGQIGHNRPKVHKPPAECLLGTGSGFDPLEGHPGPLRGFVYNVNRQTCKAAAGPNLDWWNVLKANAQNTSRDAWPVDRDVPISRHADQGGGKKD